MNKVKCLKKFVLLEEFKKKYEADGFYIFKNILSEQAARHISQLVTSSYSGISEDNISKKNIFEFVYRCEQKKMFDDLYGVYKIMADSDIMCEIENQLISFSKILFNKKYKHLTRGFAIGVKGSKRTSYDWHQEQAYYPKLTDTLHYQFPMINKCNKLNGTMSVLAGSHKEGFINNVQDKTLSRKSVQILLPKNIKKLEKKYQEVYINMDKNDLVIFDPNIIHRSNPTESVRNKTRFAGIVRLEKKS